MPFLPLLRRTSDVSSLRSDDRGVGANGQVTIEPSSRQPGAPDARTPPVRVLVVIDALRRAGAENLLVSLVRSSATVGLRVDVLSLRPIDGDATVAPDLRTAGAGVASLRARRLLDPTATWRLRRLLRSGAYDVVHAHLEYAAAMTAVAARRTGVPVVSSFHHVPGDVTRRTLLKEWIAVRMADGGSRVITVSHAQLDAFRQRYPRLSGHWEVVHNGIDLDAFVAAAGSLLPADLRGRGGPVVAFVARLRDGKGHAAALRSWSSIRERVPGAHLLIVGDGAMRDDLEQLAAELDVAADVTFTGMRRDVAAIVAGADLVVLPSETEALPTTLIEAGAARTCVVATDVGGVSEVVRDGHTGVLVPPRDERAFAAAVVALLTDDDRREALARTAQQQAIDRFDARVWAARLAALYRQTLHLDEWSRS